MDNSGKEGAPGAASTGPGAVIRSTEGSQRHEVVFIIFLTMKQMSIHGDPRLRPWLERRMAAFRQGPGEVVEFHQDARSRGIG